MVCGPLRESIVLFLAVLCSYFPTGAGAAKVLSPDSISLQMLGDMVGGVIRIGTEGEKAIIHNINCNWCPIDLTE